MKNWVFFHGSCHIRNSTKRWINCTASTEIYVQWYSVLWEWCCVSRNCNLSDHLLFPPSHQVSTTKQGYIQTSAPNFSLQPYCHHTP